MPTSAEYSHYINSDAWKAVRVRAFQERGVYCEACQTRLRLHVHHRTYARFKREEIEDLRILCETCHSLVHQAERTSTLSLEQATDLILDRGRQLDALRKYDEKLRLRRMRKSKQPSQTIFRHSKTKSKGIQAPPGAPPLPAREDKPFVPLNQRDLSPQARKLVNKTHRLPDTRRRKNLGLNKRPS